MRNRRLALLLPSVLALAAVVTVAWPDRPQVNAEQAQTQLVEARTHYERILPLIRNFHNDQAGGEMIAAVDHLDTLSSALGGRIPASPETLRSLRATAVSLARRDIGIGVPPEMAAALEALRAELERAAVAVPARVGPVRRA